MLVGQCSAIGEGGECCAQNPFDVHRCAPPDVREVDAAAATAGSQYSLWQAKGLNWWRMDIEGRNVFPVLGSVLMRSGKAGISRPLLDLRGEVCRL